MLPNNSTAAVPETVDPKFAYHCQKCLTPNSITKTGYFCASCTASMMPKCYPCKDCNKEFSASSLVSYCELCWSNHPEFVLTPEDLRRL